MASWIRPRANVLFARDMGIITGHVAPICPPFHKGRQHGILTDVKSKEHSEKSHFALRRPATAETRGRQGNCHGSSAGYSRGVLSRWACSILSQRVLSPCDLPTHEDFKFERDKFGVVFTRTHEGTITEIDLLEYELSSALPLHFFFTVKSRNKKRFMCELNVSTVQENMTEEDIYNIVLLKVDGKRVLHKTDKPQVIKGEEELEKKCFKYLKKHGLTQKFLYFLTNTFLPEYKEQINHLADIIDDETV